MKEKRKLSELHEWKDNPRSIAPKDFERLKGQIKKLGQYKPLLITKDGEVIGGNMRLKAYRELGINEVWVSVVDPKDENEKLEYALSDNDRAGYYDDDMLANLIPNYNIDWSQYAVDMKPPEDIQKLIDRIAPVEEDEAPEVSNEPAISKLGEVYQLGRHRLMCGDSTKIEDVEKLMDGKKADMVFTDPPYGVEYEGGMKEWEQIKNDGGDNFCEFLTTALSNIKIVTKEGAGWYVWHGVLRAKDVYQSFDNIWEYKRTQIIWNKNRLAAGWGDYRYKHECCVYRHGQFYGGRDETTVWDIPLEFNYQHPTQKPVRLSVKALENSSKSEDIIVDLFGGSGSTLIACEQTNRICYMCEIDPHYCDVIRKRYAKFIGKEEEWQSITPPIL